MVGQCGRSHLHTSSCHYSYCWINSPFVIILQRPTSIKMYKQQQPQKSKNVPLSYCSLRDCKDKTKQQLNCMFMIKDLIKNTTCTFFTFGLS